MWIQYYQRIVGIRGILLCFSFFCWLAFFIWLICGGFCYATVVCFWCLVFLGLFYCFFFWSIRFLTCMFLLLCSSFSVSSVVPLCLWYLHVNEYFISIVLFQYWLLFFHSFFLIILQSPKHWLKVLGMSLLLLLYFSYFKTLLCYLPFFSTTQTS